MIGQSATLNTVDYWIKTDQVPRFMIISGAIGSGRTTISKEIAKRMRAYVIECELSVDAVREAATSVQAILCTCSRTLTRCLQRRRMRC